MNKKLLIAELILLSLIFLSAVYLGQIILRQTPDAHAYLVYVLLILLTFSVLVLTYLIFRAQRSVSPKERNNQLSPQGQEELHKTYEGTLKALIYALDYREHETWGHSVRVAGYATALAKQMGLKEADLRKLTWAGFLHDIGKIGIPDEILRKKAKLLPEEWEAIKRHPELGYEIVNQVDFLKNAARIILYHHERYDGHGYPQGLKGERIPLTARIFAVADALDAMTSDRPYRPARTMEEAFHEILSLTGKQFCPKCTQALAAIGVEQLRQIQLRLQRSGEVTVLQKSLETIP
ncbi:MAG: HD-GYP domain-containing protein [Firmicutes bacterium]|nr:HD-GYP domain-containing protein [Bacillota bacterium]